MEWVIGIAIIFYLVYSISHFFIQGVINVLSPEETNKHGQTQIDNIEQQLYALQNKLDDLTYRCDELEHENELLKIDNDYLNEFHQDFLDDLDSDEFENGQR